jgi:hypothetical protein
MALASGKFGVPNDNSRAATFARLVYRYREMLSEFAADFRFNAGGLISVDEIF